jgi:hypothetical protein
VAVSKPRLKRETVDSRQIAAAASLNLESAFQIARQAVQQYGALFGKFYSVLSDLQVWLPSCVGHDNSLVTFHTVRAAGAAQLSAGPPLHSTVNGRLLLEGIDV